VQVRVYVARQCSSTAERVAYANAAAAAFSNALRARYGQHWQLLLLLQDSNSSSSRQQWSAAAADLMMQRSAAAAAVVLTPPQQTEQQLQQPWNLSQDDTTHGISSGDGVQRRGWRAGDATVAPLGEVDGVVAATASQWS
jgi:hypothetical protein